MPTSSRFVFHLFGGTMWASSPTIKIKITHVVFAHNIKFNNSSKTNIRNTKNRLKHMF